MIADILFYGFCAFIFSLCILRYFRLPLWLCLLLAICLSLAAGGIAFLLLYTKSRKQLLGKREREEREKLLLHLTLEKPERVRAALLSAFSADGRDAHCEGERLSLDGKPLVPLFTMEPVGADRLARLLREFGKEPFSVACNALSADAEKLAEGFAVEVLRGDDVYRLFSRTETTPEPLICGEIPRKTAKQKLRRTFSKTNARPFFVSGILLLLMSLFTIFPVYYILTGSILLFCAVAVRLFGYA